MDTTINLDSIEEIEAAARQHSVEAARLRASAPTVHPILGETYRRRAAELELMAHVYELKAKAWSWSPATADTPTTPLAA